MGSSAPCARAHTQPPQPAKEGKQEAKAAAAAAKMATGGKRGKKDEKKHPQCLFVCKGHTGGDHVLAYQHDGQDDVQHRRG
jgi:hypothetical protein